MIVLDTNVISEVIGTPASSRVLTSVTQAELFYGVELLAEGKRRSFLSNAIEKLFSEDFAERILPFDDQAARLYGKILTGRQSIGRPMSQLDCMIAAIVRSQNAVLATRNTKDFEHCGVNLINPWEA
jgi:toxin FitB